VWVLTTQISVEESLTVSRIPNGYVFDHLSAGKTLLAYRLLEIPPEVSVLIAMNVPSEKYGKKDILKIETEPYALDSEKLNRIALISPHTTVNVIKNSKVIEKFSVEIPERITDIYNCPNPTCFSNARGPEYEKRTGHMSEPVEPDFSVIDTGDAVKLRCRHCQRIFDGENLSFVTK